MKAPNDLQLEHADLLTNDRVTSYDGYVNEPLQCWCIIGTDDFVNCRMHCPHLECKPGKRYTVKANAPCWCDFNGEEHEHIREV